jgi:phosphatidylserine/phosphatidylglycerophosphate/cardiolipin synthase-like enzyme
VSLQIICSIEIGDERVSQYRLAFTWPPGLGSEVPDGPELVEELVRLIRSARFTIDLYFYNINSSGQFVLARSLHEALARRGVSVRIYCDQRTQARQIFDTFGGSKHKISAWYWNVPENEMSKFHVKAIVADGRRFYLGSANMSHTAMNVSAECGLFGTDRNISNQLQRYTQLFVENGSLVVIE